MIKCCGKTPTIRMMYRYKVGTINCKQCKKMWDVHVPDYIPPEQYPKYVDKKYNEIILKEKIILDNALHDKLWVNKKMGGKLI
jgi:transcription elongation factor Elf1